jgi:putative transposase
MEEYESLSHTKWECKYHVVCSSRNAAARHCMRNCESTWERYSGIWRSRRRVGLKRGSDERPRAHADRDTAKYAGSQVVGFVKGNSAIHLARVYGERKQSFVGQHFWARGYFVSTVGRDEAVIRTYI